MDRVVLHRDLIGQGFHPDEVARLRRSGQLVRIRRGAYTDPSDAELEPRSAHLRLLEATLRQSSADLVVSHMSAAAVHGLPIWIDRQSRVQFTRDRTGGSKRRRYSEIYGRRLPDEDVVFVNGMRVTSLARTVLDLACALPMDKAVPIGDAAVRRGVDPAELARLLLRYASRAGVRGARRSIAFLDGRSESPGESFSRVVLHQQGVVAPDLQYDVVGPSGSIVGRTDFAWRERRTLGEFDGKTKYGRLLRPGQTIADAVFAEKRREDRLRDLGWQVVRWIWADLHSPTDLLERLDRAFARGLRSA